MARKRIRDNPGPFSLRLPLDMRDKLELWAKSEYRSLHSLILAILADAVRGHQPADERSESAGNVARNEPTP